MGLGFEMSTRTGCSSKRDATNKRLWMLAGKGVRSYRSRLTD